VLNYPLVLEDAQFVIDAELPVLQSMGVDGPRRIILAGQYRDCAPAGAGDWTIRFRPETAFLWCHFDTLKAIGFEAGGIFKDEEIREVLAQQCKLEGIEP
jgi:hypothetical protein